MLDATPVARRRVGPHTVCLVYPSERSTLLGGRPRKASGSETVYAVIASRSKTRATVATGCSFEQAEQTLASLTPALLKGLKFR